MTSRMDRLIAGRYRISSFAALPVPHQLALAHYLSVDGERWECFVPMDREYRQHEISAMLHQVLPRYVQHYGDELFGLLELPLAELKDCVLADPELADDWPNWDAYHAWYCSTDTPNHSSENRWPVILSSWDEETFQDGWHRFHCYARQGAEVIPALFFPQQHHLAS